MTPYRPSNGEEGEWFYRKYCAKCEKDRASWEREDYENGCEIYRASLMYFPHEEDYPDALIQDDSGPRCTAFEPVFDPDAPLEGQGELFQQAFTGNAGASR